jgi:hypothetical protein
MSSQGDEEDATTTCHERNEMWKKVIISFGKKISKQIVGADK